MEWRKYIGIALICFFCTGMVGCGLSAAQRASIIREASNTAAIRAADLAKREALKAGLSEEAAIEVGRIAADKARELAADGADKITPEADPNAGKWGGVIASLLVSGLQIAAGGMKS